MRVRILAPILIATLGLGACAGPHRAAKTLGGAGAILAVAGGTAWVVGARNDSDAGMVPGVVAVVAGIVLMATAGAMMAAEVSCRADADCPIGQQCRGVPAAAGRIPYSQCVPR